ncbi:uncharacterized protein LOC141525764 [Cotesia typhae]|uniref:uncharacterized protein LOC141525764 n=1 Tax=Cotesia typhae TaxID=2053667 RepID=UPI003D69C685
MSLNKIGCAREKMESVGEPPAKKKKQVECSRSSDPGESITRSDSFTLKNMSGSLPRILEDQIIDLSHNKDNNNNNNIILFDEVLSQIDLPVDSNNINHPELSKEVLSALTELEEVLWSRAEGKGIFRYYNQHKAFDEIHRKRLANLIIQFEINKSCAGLSLKGEDKLKDFVITTNQLKEYADLNTHLFPSEVNETYFIPTRSTKKRRILASGRLWNCYNNAKGRLREDCLLRRKINNHYNEDIPGEVLSRQVNHKIERLKAGITLQLHDLLILWSETFEILFIYSFIVVWPWSLGS